MNENIFEYVDLAGEVPSCICDKCAKLGMMHLPTESTFCYCRHHEAGAMRSPGSAWIEATHISAKDFKAALLQAVLEGEQQYIDDQTGGDEIRH